MPEARRGAGLCFVASFRSIPACYGVAAVFASAVGRGSRPRPAADLGQGSLCDAAPCGQRWHCDCVVLDEEGCVRCIALGCAVMLSVVTGA